MAGPWFTVHDEAEDWQRLDRIWISDGEHNSVVDIEYRVRLDHRTQEM